tara:strand:+ start:2884 stop:4521 length:1638 start_codon:yes stop_codon:yes gene_type:complete
MAEPLFFWEIEQESGWSEVKQAIRNSVTEEKYNRVLNYFSYPLPIVSIANDISEDLNRVFNGRNANFSVQYPNKRAEAQSRDLLMHLNTREWIEKHGRKVFKCQPQTIVVVDKDTTGVPYYLSIGIDKLIGYDCDEYDEFKYIIFEHSEGVDDLGKFKKIAFYDDEFYRVIEQRSGQMSLITENAHGLKYCPARWFVDESLNSRDKAKRYAPLSPVLGTMSEWTQFYAYSFYAEHYGVFPVVEFAAAVCEEEFCTNGMVSYPLESGGMSTPTNCPSCTKNKFNGAGTAIKINPRIDNEENDSSGYFRFISPPTANLEFEQTKQDHRENFIKVNTTGFNDVISKDAVNADQVRSLMEDRKKPLLKLAGICNRLHRWLVKTAVKLAIDVDVMVHANYGTEWFLLTEAQLQQLFKGAKDAGLPESEIDQLYNLLIETKYKGQPQTVQKLMIENNLNPQPYQNIKECFDLVANGVMTQLDLYIKANLIKFIKRFERENGSIVEFGSDISFEQKIDIIYNTFKNYVRNENETDQDDTGQPVGDAASQATD